MGGLCSHSVGICDYHKGISYILADGSTFNSWNILLPPSGFVVVCGNRNAHCSPVIAESKPNDIHQSVRSWLLKGNSILQGLSRAGRKCYLETSN